MGNEKGARVVIEALLHALAELHGGRKEEARVPMLKACEPEEAGREYPGEENLRPTCQSGSSVIE